MKKSTGSAVGTLIGNVQPPPYTINLKAIHGHIAHWSLEDSQIAQSLQATGRRRQMTDLGAIARL